MYNTRSKVKATPHINMAENEQTTPRTSDEEEASEGVNNQLGIAGIFDEMTPVEFVGPRPQDGAQEAEEERPETQEEGPVVAEKRGGGQNQDVEMIGIDRFAMMLRAMTEDIKKDIKRQGEKIDKQIESIKKDNEALREDIKGIKKDVRTLHEEIQAQKQAMAAEFNVIRDENAQMRTELKADISAVKEEGKKTRKELKDSNDAIKHLRSEVEKNRQQLVTNTSNLSDNVNRVNAELRGELRLNTEEITRVRKSQEGIEEQVKKMEEEKSKGIDEIKKSQDQLTRRINEVEERPGTRTVAAEYYKELTFNGSDSYPMDFLQELKEARQECHSGGDIRWISKYLSGDAKIWWRIIRTEISTFEQFEERFIEKFWGAHIQESVRDRLEFGRYRPGRENDPIQYMHRQILQCRQLVPPITDQHLIRKLAKNYGRDIELAVLTRGIRDIPQFESLLRDYMRIGNHINDRPQQSINVVKHEVSEPSQQQGRVDYNAPRPLGKFHQKYGKKYNSQYTPQVEAVAGPSGSDTQKNVTSTQGQ